MAESESDPSNRVTGVGRSSGRRLVALQVGQFALAGLVAFAIVGVATAIASRRIGEREAIAGARLTTVTRAQGLVAPELRNELLQNDQAAVDLLDDVVRKHVLDESLVRVKLWARDDPTNPDDPTGRIVYSDERALRWSTWRLGEEELSAMATGEIKAEVSDLSEPENRFETEYGRLLEVYLPVRTPDGTVLLFEAYYKYGLVTANGQRLWRSFAPISIGALVMLELVQLPLAWSLARRLREHLREREALLGRALEASDVERRQIASDLHDSVVQDLAGVAFALSAATRRGSDVEADGRVIAESAESVRGSIRALRSLLVDIYPPNFGEVTLESALTDLLTRAQDSGLEAQLDAGGLRSPLPDHIARLIYRVVQEGVRNTIDHASAATLTVTVGTDGADAYVEVADNGRGFESARLAERQASGHMGLTALRGLVADSGGVLLVRSEPGEGTVLRATVPVR